MILSPYIYTGWEYAAYRVRLDRENLKQQAQFSIKEIISNHFYYTNENYLTEYLGTNFEQAQVNLDKILEKQGFLLLNEIQYEKFKKLNILI